MRIALPSLVGHDPETSRDLFVLELESIDQLPEQFHLPSKQFVALTLMDSDAVSGRDLMRFAGRLLDTGAAYVSAWGPDCERVHDIVDDALVLRHLVPKQAHTPAFPHDNAFCDHRATGGGLPVSGWADFDPA